MGWVEELGGVAHLEDGDELVGVAIDAPRSHGRDEWFS
jgi:hypothetical protein